MLLATVKQTASLCNKALVEVLSSFLEGSMCQRLRLLPSYVISVRACDILPLVVDYFSNLTRLVTALPVDAARCFWPWWIWYKCAWFRPIDLHYCQLSFFWMSHGRCLVEDIHINRRKIPSHQNVKAWKYLLPAAGPGQFGGNLNPCPCPSIPPPPVGQFLGFFWSSSWMLDLINQPISILIYLVCISGIQNDLVETRDNPHDCTIWSLLIILLVRGTI